VLYGWRHATIDVDIRLDPESDELLRELPRLKETLSINVELASPADFIPVKDGWENRSVFAMHSGRASAYHFDLYAQALSKLERGHERDLNDVRAMLERKLIDTARLVEYYDEIAPSLYRFPAIDPAEFRRSVMAFVESSS
jgi:hypothetical protein